MVDKYSDTSFIISKVRELISKDESFKNNLLNLLAGDIIFDRKYFEVLMRSIPDNIYFKDSEGRFTHINHSQARLLGLTDPSDAIGKTDFDFFNEEHAKISRADEQSIMASGQPIIGKIEKLKVENSDFKWFSATKIPLKDENGNTIGIAGISRDITKQRQDEDYLKLFYSAFNQMQEAVVITDSILDPPGPQIQYVNPAFTEITGYTPEEIIGKTPRILQGPKTDRKTIVRLKNCLLEGKEFIGETVNYKKDGTEYILNWTISLVRDQLGNVANFISVQRDVTEHRLTQQALTESELRYKTLFDLSANAILITDDKNNVIQNNREAELLSGYRSSDLKNMNIELLLPAAQTHSEQTSEETGIHPHDTFLVNKTGEHIPVVLKSRTFTMNEVPETIYFLTNISERKKYEAELKKYAEELNILNNSKDRLFSIIGHDLRGPFHSLMAISDILSSDLDSISDEEINSYSRQMYNVLNNQYKLLENLMNWSGIQSGKVRLNKSDVNLYEKVSEVFSVFGITARNKGIILNNEIPEDAIVEADEQLLLSLLHNLVSNAIKFTPPDGKVTVRCAKTGNEYKIIVEDSGKGMTKDKLDRLFRIDSVSSTTGTAGERGSGIGLILCKDIAELHGSDLAVESESGKGTQFSFSLKALT